MANKSDPIPTTLSTPSQFKANRKPNLIPPSTFKNQAAKNAVGVMKTPSDFTLKQSNKPSVVDCQLSCGKSKNEIKEMPKTSFESNKYDKNLNSLKVNENDSYNVPCSSGSDPNVLNSKVDMPTVRRPPPGFSLLQQNFQESMDVTVGSEDIASFSSFDDGADYMEMSNLGCVTSNVGTVSKKEYKKLENMYIESKNKLDCLEMKFFKIMKASGKQKLEMTGKNENDYEEKLIKQVEAFKFQNEFLCDKLQKLEQGQYSDVKGAVDRYLSQNQFETEKVALNNRILELERDLFEKNKDNENLLKELEGKDLRYEKAMLRNNEERYSYEECIVKLNARISEMMDENEKLRSEKEDGQGKFEDSMKKVSEVNQVVESKDKCIDELSMKVDLELKKTGDLNKKIEVQKETYESALANVEKMLKEEVINNANMKDEINEYKTKVRLLENKLDEMNHFIIELQHDNDKKEVLKNHMDLKCEEIVQLQSSCRALQSTNETLNIRINSLSEILDMQEPYTKGLLKGDKEKMLQMWREKVYSLLVMLKVQEMKTKKETGDYDFDGSSTL